MQAVAHFDRLEAAAGEMMDVRSVEERDEAKANRLAIALRCASDYAGAGTKIPAYLEKAALRFDAQLERAGDIFLAVRLVEEFTAAGFPANNVGADGNPSAFDKAAEKLGLGLGAATVQKLYYANRDRLLEQFPARPKGRTKTP